MARKTLSSISLAQIVGLVGLILAGYFLIGFGEVALVSHQLRNTKATLQAEVTALEEEVAHLEARKQYVQTDAYVEKAAREEYKMSRPGDQVVVPMYREGNGTDTQRKPATNKPAAPTPREPWRAWWELFFGQ